MQRLPLWNFGASYTPPNKALQLTRPVERVLTSSFGDVHNGFRRCSNSGAGN